MLGLGLGLTAPRPGPDRSEPPAPEPAIQNGRFDADLTGWTCYATNPVDGTVQRNDACMSRMPEGFLRMTALSNGRFPQAQTPITGLTVGQTYTVTITHASRPERGGTVRIAETGGPSPTGIRAETSNILDPGAQGLTFVATRTTHHLLLTAGVETPGAFSDFDDIGIQPGAVAAPAASLNALYGTGPGQIPMRHVFSAARLNATGHLLSSVNAGGAGALLNLTPGSVAVPVTGGRLDLQPTMNLRLNGTTTTSRPDLIGTRVFVVTDLRGLTNDQYLLGNGSPQMNVWIVAGGASLRVNRRNPATNAFETVIVALSPVLTGARRLYEIEFTPTTINVFVNGNLRGTAPHRYAELRMLDFAAGQNPANGNGLNAWVSEVLMLLQGGDYAANVATIRQRLTEIHAVAS